MFNPRDKWVGAGVKGSREGEDEGSVFMGVNEGHKSVEELEDI